MMEPIRQSTERREIGLALHEAETAIGIGRQLVVELLEVDPVDEAAVAAQQSSITEARLTRNTLRRDLQFVKARDAKSPTWLY